MNKRETSLTIIMWTKPFKICWNYFCWHLTPPIQPNPTTLLPNSQVRLILVTTFSSGSSFSFLTRWLFKSKTNYEAIKLTSVTREADRLETRHTDSSDPQCQRCQREQGPAKMNVTLGVGGEEEGDW